MSGNVEVACGHLKYSHLPKVLGKAKLEVTCPQSVVHSLWMRGQTGCVEQRCAHCGLRCEGVKKRTLPKKIIITLSLFVLLFGLFFIIIRAHWHSIITCLCFVIHSHLFFHPVHCPLYCWYGSGMLAC